MSDTTMKFTKRTTTSQDVSPYDVLKQFGAKIKDLRIYPVGGGILRAIIAVGISAEISGQKVMGAYYRLALGQVTFSKGQNKGQTQVRILGSMTDQNDLVPINRRPKELPKDAAFSSNASVSALFMQATENVLRDLGEKGHTFDGRKLVGNETKNFDYGHIFEPKKGAKDMTKLSELFEIGTQGAPTVETKNGKKASAKGDDIAM